MSKGQLPVQDTERGGETQSAPSPGQAATDFGSNAERIAYIEGLRSVDDEMKSQLDAGLPDTELGILLIERATTGALKGFYDNDEWKATATERFEGGQLTRFDHAMTTVWRVSELMREATENREFELALTRMQSAFESRITKAANKFAAFAEEGTTEDIGSPWIKGYFDAPFNAGPVERFGLDLVGSAEVTCSHVDEGWLWTERLWGADVRTHLTVTRKDALDRPQEVKQELWGFGMITTYSDDNVSALSVPTLEMEWDAADELQ